MQHTIAVYTANRDKLLDLLGSTVVQLVRKSRKKRKKRQFWIRPGRTPLWWENLRNNVAVIEEWQENLRMSQTTFNKLCDELRPYLTKKETTMRKPLDVETQVALTLYYLADEGRYRKVANAFGIARCTISRTVRTVCKAISTKLGPLYIKLPSTPQEVMTINFISFRTTCLTFEMPQAHILVLQKNFFSG